MIFKPYITKIGLVLITCYINCQASMVYSFTLDKSYIKSLMKEGNIVGLSIAAIDKNNDIHFLNLGYSDKEKQSPVTNKTFFEIASLSKGFTSLGIVYLSLEKKINLYDKLSKYFPNTAFYYKNKRYDITIEQLLYQTSGISFNTITLLDKTKDFNKLIQELSKNELKFIPGSGFEYSSVNYVLLGQIIEKVTQESFMYFISKICKAIDITCFPADAKDSQVMKAVGYKIGFTKSFPYQAPIYQLNYAGGYMMLNIENMSKWLRFQVNLDCNKKNYNLELAACISQKSNENLLLEKFEENYTMGWFTDNKYNISNSGLNPNFSSYIAINKKNTVGVVVLANTNSPNTYKIGDYIFKQLNNTDYFKNKEYESFISIDMVSSLLFIIMITFNIFMFLKIKLYIHTSNNKLNLGNTIWTLIIFLLILYLFYFIPQVLLGIYWKTLLIWLPISSILCYCSMITATVFTLTFLYLRGIRS